MSFGSLRRTVATPYSRRGVTLFTGTRSSITIHPARSGEGIVFRRVDLEGEPVVPARIEYLTNAPVHPAFELIPARYTHVRAGEASVAVTEHVLGALAGSGVTDAVIDIDGPEVPILDGSAREFLSPEAPVSIEGSAQPITLEEELVVQSGNARIVAMPREHAGMTIAYNLDFGPEGDIEPQSVGWSGDLDEFAREIAPARTFCLHHEAERMHAAGLFTHLTNADMLVIGPEGPIDNALRFPDEPARHKLLDLVGDLALAGSPIQANIIAFRSGHALNHELARRLAELRSD